MKWNSKPAIAAYFVAFSLIFATWGLPPIIRSVAVKKLSEKLNREVSIGDININPLMLKFEIRDFAILQKGSKDEFVAFDKVKTRLSLSSIYKGGVVLPEFTLTGPRVFIERFEDNTYNFSDLLENKDAPAKDAPPKDEKPTRFFVGNFKIEGGKVGFNNRPTKNNHVISHIDLFVPVISNLPVYTEQFANPKLSFLFDGTHVNLEGKTKPFTDSLETKFELSLKDLDLTKYLPYSPTPLNFDVPSALLDVDATLSYVQHREKAPTVNLSGEVGLKKLALVEKGGNPLVSLEKLLVAIDPSEISSRQIRLAKVTLERPQVNVVVEKDGSLNLDALKQKSGNGEKPAESSTPPDVKLAKFALVEGVVNLTHKGLWKPFSTRLEALGAEVDNLALPENKFDMAKAEFKTDSGETFNLGSAGTFDPVNLKGDWKLAGLNLPKYHPFYGEKLNFGVRKGILDLAGNFSVEGEDKIELDNVSALLDGLTLVKTNEKIPFLELKKFVVAQTRADLKEKSATVGKMQINGLTARVARNKEGTLSTDDLVKKDEKAPKAEPNKDGEWAYKIESFNFAKGLVEFDDQMVTGGAKLNLADITLDGRGITNAQGQKASIKAKLVTGKAGTLALEGPVSINPLAGELHTDIKDADLPQFNPYLAEKVKLLLASAGLNISGKAVFAQNAEELSYSYNGNLSVTNFKALERDSAEELISWSSLGLDGIAYQSSPKNMTVEGISITDPYLRIDIGPDGAINLSNLKVDADATQSAPVNSDEKPKDALPLELKAVALQGATINFTDRHIKPNYGAKIVNLTGRVTRMSSEDSSGGEVTMLGSVDNYAPLEITGKLNPFSKDLLVDLKIAFNNVELSPMTPYSSRYLGYKIDKGKLGMALQYKILGKSLDSQNKVVLDQLTLGDEVESTEATGLPVRFALALLTDRKGMIDLDVPVTGTLDDPDFSYGKIIWKVLVNIIVKAATSPFALIGSLFGGGEELSYAIFAPGADALAPSETSKLDKLSKALVDRPALRLEVEGHVDPENDRLALRDNEFARKLKAQKIKTLVQAGQTAPELDTVEITPEERPTILALAFEAEKIPKPANTSRALTPEEIEKLMLTHIAITDDNLKALANQRAKAVLDYLVKAGNVEPGRVFLMEPKELKPKAIENAKDTRADFTLK